MSLLPRLEAVLFVASKPLTVKQLANALSASQDEVLAVLKILCEKWNIPESGIHILSSVDSFQMVSNPELSEVVEKFVQKEITSELTRAQLETLTVIAYRGPITRPEIEQIRGVNCSLILRNLLMRGLLEEQSQADDLVPSYVLSIDALRVLGIGSPTQLPDYEILHAHEYLDRALESSIHDM